MSGIWVFLPCMAVAAGIAFVANLRPVPQAVEQPIAFNHKLHVEDQGLECNTCHKGFETGPRSGYPSEKTCALCHAQAQGEGAEELKLVQLLESGAKLDWQPLFRQPPHVFFSHVRHVKVAGLECATCHGDIAQSTRPPTVPRPLRMAQCIECHEQQQASVGCSSCHR